jgi:hypothetical protein
LNKFKAPGKESRHWEKIQGTRYKAQESKKAQDTKKQEKIKGKKDARGLNHAGVEEKTVVVEKNNFWEKEMTMVTFPPSSLAFLLTPPFHLDLPCALYLVPWTLCLTPVPCRLCLYPNSFSLKKSFGRIPFSVC